MNTIINTLSNTAASADNSVYNFERETGWTYGDALEMAVEARSDARHFGHRKGSKSRRNARPSTQKVDLETSIGWGPGSLVDFIAENRREERLFGRTQLYV